MTSRDYFLYDIADLDIEYIVDQAWVRRYENEHFQNIARLIEYEWRKNNG